VQQRTYALLPAEHDGAIVPAMPFDASPGALHRAAVFTNLKHGHFADP